MSILKREENRTLTNTTKQRVSEQIRESQLDGLSLSEYVLAKETNCRNNHPECKIGCKEMAKAAKIVLNKRYVSLSSVWREVFPTKKYDCEKAQRKLLQMPVVSIRMNTGCVLAEKKSDGLYEQVIVDISQRSEWSNTEKDIGISKEDFRSFLNALPNIREGERMKHILASTHNMSARQGETFGIRGMRDRADKIQTATEAINRLKSKHMYFAKIEQQVFLESVGRNTANYLSDDSSDSEQDEDDNKNQTDSEQEEDMVNDSKSKENQSVIPEIESTIMELSQNDTAVASYQSEHSLEERGSTNDEQIEDDVAKKDLPVIDVNSVNVLDILREVEWNWFSLVLLLEPKFQSHGYSQQVFDQFLVDFAGQIPQLGLSDEELNLTEQSRTAYLSEIMQKEIRIEEIIHEDSSDDEAGYCAEEIINEEEVRRKLKLIKDKAKRMAKFEIDAKGLFGKRKSSKSTTSVLARHPEIGQVIENMVKDADIGADKWRRTGVYTFSGDQKKEKKMTYKKLQTKLSEHYGEHFSYGTVLQLCVPRNKRCVSSKRYKAVANVKYQRARKGFSLKFNPDTKWSRSFYKCLDHLQNDGTHLLLLNRDDQAGFRLDSTFTHKATPSLNVSNETLTTHTDFLNKHTSQLQTTSYNFTRTSTTSEVCGGIVKASILHQKNPSQHAADLELVQSIEQFKPLFYKEGNVKDIECIRVDGASDEGPGHLEVQFLWTERHMKTPTKITLVTTRSSGDSFLNRVELQNGCLSRSHSNLFIPSTLCGDPYDADGQFDEAKHCENLKAALQQYIARVDGSPCMKTSISLHMGMSRNEFVERRSRLLVFLKGSTKARAQLREEDAEEYKYFEKVWKVRCNHMNKTLPSNYVFFLKCCGEDNCPHPLCAPNTTTERSGFSAKQASVEAGRIDYKDVVCTCRKPEGKKLLICCDQCGEWYHHDCVGLTEAEVKRMGDEEENYICQNCFHPVESDFVPKWFLGGPSFNFFPYPVIDCLRPWGSECNSCGGQCSGHYVTDVTRLLQMYTNGKAIRALPPSVIIKEEFLKDTFDMVDVVALAKKCCLSKDDVLIWVQHLKKKKITKAKAVLKAQETRKKNRQKSKDAT